MSDSNASATSSKSPTSTAPADLTRTPVLVGAGQVTNRDEDPARAPNPFELMKDASIAAANDIGGARRLGDLTHVWMVHSLSVRHGDPSTELAKQLGADKAEARCSGMGGSVPQWLVNRAAELVLSGIRPLVLIVGAEALATRRRARKAGVELDWPTSPGWPNTWPALEPDLGVHAVERASGLDQATTMYALVETAVCHAAGRSIDQQRAAMGRLMERFNAIAVDNPYSWFQKRRDADEITTVSAENRMVCFPYPKYVNAVMDVDMAAAVLVTDAATAREIGLAENEVAHVAGWADAHDVWYLSQRPEVHTAPALSRCSTEALRMAGLGVDDLEAFDLYSCFPSSIEVARDTLAIDVDDDRPLTLTGGLPYHGGPGSNYVTHALANTLQRLRSGGGPVLVHGNGYYLTKHALGVYTNRTNKRTTEPDGDLQKQIDALTAPIPVLAPEDLTRTATATVAAYTVPFGRDGSHEAAIALISATDGPDEDRQATSGQTIHSVVRCGEKLTSDLLDGDGVGSTVLLEKEDGGVVATAG